MQVSRQQGFSPIEIALVVALVMAIGVAAFFAVKNRSLSEAQKTTLPTTSTSPLAVTATPTSTTGKTTSQPTPTKAATPAHTAGQAEARVEAFFNKYVTACKTVQCPSSPQNAFPGYLSADLSAAFNKDPSHTVLCSSASEIVNGTMVYTADANGVGLETAVDGNIYRTLVKISKSTVYTIVEVDLPSLLITKLECK